MRKYFAVYVLIVLMHVSIGAEPVAEDVLSWQPAFSAVSASKTDQTLVLMLITNDDAFEATNAGPETQGPTAPWCGPIFERSYRKAIQARADLKDKCVLQSVVAGMPKLLTGGSPRNQPARAIVAICDGSYQLLSLAVGVPDADELLTMIEDAQEAKSLIKLNDRDEAKVAVAMANRSMQRITRLWRDALQEMLATIDLGNKADPNEASDPSAKQLTRLGQIAETYEAVYLADVKLRFGLTQAADRTRLVILEQHPEARDRGVNR